MKADIHATDEDGDNALLIALLKRSQLEGEVTESSPAIHSIYQRTKQHEHGRALAIACYFIKQGTNIEAANNKEQTAFNLVRDQYTFLSSYIPPTETNDTELAQVHKDDTNKDVLTNNTECLFCLEETEENVTLEPCGHKPACEDCSARMKKCLVCGEFVQKRVTKDGQVIPGKSRQPSAERLKYLESKIAEIEESNACSICMERKRNVVFLCGHGTCHKCADTLKRCHMCRKTITKKIPIY